MVPAVGRLHQPDLALDGTGESALFVAEEFGFHQVGGNRGAVDIEKFLLARRRGVVDHPRQQPLAGAGFAIEQHGAGGAAGHPIRQLTQGDDAGMLADQRALIIRHVLRRLHGAGQAGSRIDCQRPAQGLPSCKYTQRGRLHR
jgi:hypothetical protein